MFKIKTNIKGFTLIELLMVILIIGLLAVIFIPMVLGEPRNSRDTLRVSDLRKIQNIIIASDVNGIAVPLTSQCINNGSFEMASLAMMGGLAPSDPLETSWVIEDPDETLACDGEYLFVVNPTTGYDFGLYARMEVVKNGNMACPDGVLTDTHTITNNGPGECFGVLQKL
ncbi:hypothetical protein CVV38_01845 [Candidatus Peregrinibacteria bacterium HGW-Peregrinibacteria-1]|jgi:prepilin-type N-terminal cleavage/methylation domain-containing protein|nr:MAG: hypothetical protein CVV38_01845 [Candidatus Peregrinibacteria bacterium HGW-Peregrinibacteria-1]